MRKPARAARTLVMVLALMMLIACDSGPATPSPVTLSPPPTPAPAGTVFDSTGAGGQICQGAQGASCAPADKDATAQFDDSIVTNTGGTVGVSVQAAKFRLLGGSRMQLVARADLSLPQQFLLDAGQVLFDHQNGAGEIEVEAGVGSGTVRIQPVDTKFCVIIGPSGGVILAIYGPGQAMVTSTLSSSAQPQSLMLSGDQQVVLAPGTGLAGVQPMSAALRSLWTTYGVVAPEPTYTRGPATDTPVPTPTAVPTRTPRPTATPEPPTATNTPPPLIQAVRSTPAVVGYGACSDFTAGPPIGTTLRVEIVLNDPTRPVTATVSYFYVSDRAPGHPGPVHTAPMPAAGRGVYSAAILVAREALAELDGASGHLTYSIYAKDDQGNRGLPPAQTVPVVYCNQVTPTATATPDTRPPTLRVAASPTSVYYGKTCPAGATDLTVTAVVSDPSGIKSVMLYYGYSATVVGIAPGLAATPVIHSLAMQVPLKGPYTAVIHASQEAAAELSGGRGTLFYYVQAIDGHGNIATGKTGQVPVVPCPS